MAPRDDVHAPQGQPRQDPHRPGGDRRGQDRQGRPRGVPRGRGRRLGVRPQVQADAQLDGLPGRQRRGAAGPDRRHHQGRPAARGRARRPRRADRWSGYAAPPAWPPATSATRPRSPWPCPPTTPRTSAPSPTGSCSGGYSFKRVQVALGRLRGRRGLGAQRRRPASGRDRGPRGRADRGRAGQPCPRLGEHAAQRPHAGAVRRPCAGARQGAVGPLEAQGRHRGPRARGARRARLRRHPRRRSRLGQPAPPGQADLGARRTRGPRSRSSARASPTTPAA